MNFIIFDDFLTKKTQWRIGETFRRRDFLKNYPPRRKKAGYVKGFNLVVTGNY